MRVIVGGALGAVALESLLALAFWAGWAWLGGFAGGVVASAALAVAIGALAAGELEVEHDSRAGRTDLRLGWIARVTRRRRDGDGAPETRVRVMFVSWTRRGGERRPPQGDERRARGPLARLSALRGLAEPALRALTAAAPALHDLLWDAREISLRLESPTGVEVADRTLARFIGRRRVGPARIRFAEGEDRRLVVRYRIGLLRAGLTLIAAALQGQPQRLARAVRRGDGEVEERGGTSAREEAG